MNANGLQQQGKQDTTPCAANASGSIESAAKFDLSVLEDGFLSADTVRITKEKFGLWLLEADCLDAPLGFSSIASAQSFARNNLRCQSVEVVQ